MYNIVIINSLVEGRLGCSHFLIIGNSMAINLSEHVNVEWDVIGCFLSQPSGPK